MFLFDSSVARDWEAIEQEVHRLCNRIGAELLVCVKYDERKLAYEIKRRKRGTYVLTYLEASPERIVDLERDARLSELILRLLVLQADDVPEERIAELKTWPADTPLQPASSERRHDDHDHRSPRGPRDRDRDRERDRDRGGSPDRAGDNSPSDNASSDGASSNDGPSDNSDS
jgi:small subunit ribosomal protein S6